MANENKPQTTDEAKAEKKGKDELKGVRAALLTAIHDASPAFGTRCPADRSAGDQNSLTRSPFVPLCSWRKRS